MAPIVTGEVNPAALEDLVRLCVQLDGLCHRARDEDGQVVPEPDTTRARDALEQAIIGKTIDFSLLSRYLA